MLQQTHTAQRLTVVVLVGVAIGSGLSGPASARESTLRLTAVDSHRDGTVRMVAVVPPSLSALKLAARDFTVRQGDAVLQPKVTRLADNGMQVVIVPDRVVSGKELGLELATASELAHLLPAGTRVRAMADAEGTRMTRTEAQSMRILSGLTPNREPSAAAVIAGSTLESPLGTRRVYVLITSCSHPQPARDVRQVKALLDPESQQLDVVQIGAGCSSALAAVARESGGTAVNVPDASGLAMAADQISRELTSQYRLEVTPAVSTAPLTVAVSAMQVHAEASLPSTSPAPADKDRGSLWLVLVVVGLLVAIGVVALIAEIARSRRQVAGTA